MLLRILIPTVGSCARLTSTFILVILYEPHPITVVICVVLVVVHTLSRLGFPRSTSAPLTGETMLLDSCVLVLRHIGAWLYRVNIALGASGH